MNVQYGAVPAPGEVWLVGAGPGDPGLLTLAAARALAHADLVLHDGLPGPGVLALARPGAAQIDVGKRKGAAPAPQPRINAALIAAARQGLRVVRLKGGDPFLFARGGEEALALAEAGIPWRVIPGVSAGLAAPAAAGFPLTHRGLAGAVTFVTGHDAAGKVPAQVDWAALARLGGTIAAFMAVSRLDEIAVRLLAGGMAPATPVALLARATLTGAASCFTTLGECTLAARRATLPGPVLVVIGAVVGLAGRLRAAMPLQASAAA